MSAPVVVSDLRALADEINAAHVACERAVREGLALAAEVGRLLLQAKGQVPHGGWAEWRRTHCRFAERTAQAYMRVAKQWDRLGKTATGVADLSFRGALALLAEPKHEISTETSDDPDPPVNAQYVPAAGHLLRGSWPGLADTMWIEPSALKGQHPTYYYVSYMQSLLFDEGIVDGTIKPVAPCAIPWYLEEWLPARRLATVTWNTWPHTEPLSYNRWLFADHDAYMRDFVLGGWVAQKVHERAMRVLGVT